ncbi:hypothetical protein E0G79_21910 [Salmonella enterica]|nr:hypothetical protein [Salmonella enterica]EBA9765188.1 hypothetical protein [Salmonella enterica]
MSINDKDFSSLTVEQYGWNLGFFNHSTLFTSHFIYVYDCYKQYVGLISISQEDFNTTKISTSLSIQMCVAKLGRILKKMSNKKALSQTEEAEMAPLIINYVKQTMTFRQWVSNSELNQRMHFLINIYGSKDDKKGEVVLRPLIVNPDALILTPTEVIELNSQVIELDRLRHPEWFR